MPGKNVVVVGTGTMGPGIAEVFALGGWRTVLCGRTAGSVNSGLARARLAGTNLETFGLVEPGRAAPAAGRLTGSTDLEAAVAEAHLVVEAIAENIGAKKACFERLGRAAPPGNILATNTSGLSITAIASATARPERVAGMHWWNPPHLLPLIEVILGERTAEDTANEVAEIARGLGKLPVMVRKDVPGFIGNRLQYAVLREAVTMVEQGVASVEDIDRAMRAGPGLRYAALGPLETADFIGLDVVRDVMDYLLPEINSSPETPTLVAELVKSGKLGNKSGEGFYPRPRRRADERLTERDAKLAKLLGAGMGK